jgi:hypothetical protein
MTLVTMQLTTQTLWYTFDITVIMAGHSTSHMLTELKISEVVNEALDDDIMG